MSSNSQPILVLGAGSWGTALALLLARNGHAVTLWGHRQEHVETLQKLRQNEKYLPGVSFPDNLNVSHDLPLLLAAHQQVVISTPCKSLSEILPIINTHRHPDLHLSWACKGFYPGTHDLVHQIVEQQLGDIPAAVISGPTFAREVAEGLPGAVTVAANTPEFATELAGLLHGSSFRAYTSDDIIGVEIGGAVKNVLAIAAGIADGLGFGANTRAALITRGLAEIMRLGEAVGAQPETFMGLAGLGDLALTCTDNQSRNRRMGLALAKGLSIEEAAAEIGQAVEGVRTAVEVSSFATEIGIEMPITREVARVIMGDITPEQAVMNLLSREAKPESS